MYRLHVIKRGGGGLYAIPAAKPSPHRLLPLVRVQPVRRAWLSARTKHILAFGTLGLLIGMGWFLLIGFFMPRTVVFAYGQAACVFNPQLLPGLTAHDAPAGYQLESPGKIHLGRYALVAFQTCARPASAPEPSVSVSARLSPLYNPFFYKRIHITADTRPVMAARFDPGQAVGAASQLAFSLDKPDATHAYQLVASGTSAACQVQDTSLSCPLAPLGLAPAQTYSLTLERRFGNEAVDTPWTSSVTTLDPVVLTSASIAAGTTVYDNPQAITMTFNKSLAAFGQIEVQSDQGNTIPVSPVIGANGQLTVGLGAPLARKQSYSLRIGQLTATDDSQLLEPLVVPFYVSGGPKVTGINIGSRKVAQNSVIRLTFDSPLAGSQDLAALVSISTGSARISVDNTTISIRPDASLPFCTAFTVQVKPGLINGYGIGDGEAYEFKSRTICSTSFQLGTSVQGRAIMAYRYGNGSDKIVFVGGMHGNEKSSVLTLQSWMEYLEDNAASLPANRSVVVIPNHNPDGYPSSRRTNANNVDLNRNFPANDWQTSVQMPGNITLPQGGGVSPLDQPESAALAAYIQRERPRLVLTYHAVAKVVISNDAGDSVAQASAYAADASYPFTSNANSFGTFDYATTGEFEDWLADKENIPAVLVELSSMTRDEFSAHRRAMWNTITR